MTIKTRNLGSLPICPYKDILRTVIFFSTTYFLTFKQVINKFRGKTPFFLPYTVFRETQVLENLDFLRLINMDLENLKAYQ